MNEALKLATANGWRPTFLSLRHLHNVHCDSEVVLDPKFWTALGKALGNKDVMRCSSPLCETVRCEYAGYKNMREEFLSYMRIVWDGGDTEKFWKDLIQERKNQ